MMYIHLITKHDVNGNPRRLYLVLDDLGIPVDAIDEGYAGSRNVRNKYPNVVDGPRIVVTPTEYRGWLKWAAQEVK